MLVECSVAPGLGCWEGRLAVEWAFRACGIRLVLAFQIAANGMPLEHHILGYTEGLQ